MTEDNNFMSCCECDWFAGVFTEYF